jgi:hypothetical protein
MRSTDANDSLIWNEIVERRRRGDTFDIEEYARRYPHLADALRHRDAAERLINTAVWPATLAPTSPHAFGQFRVLRRLGAGSFGTVWLCQDDQLGRQVALKVLHPHCCAPADLARFLAEARSVAALDDHPHIVKVLSAGESGGSPYIVYKYVPGTTLAERLAKGPLPPLQAAALIAQLANALGHCHRHGVFHRDVKPANILLDERGRPLLIDFGLALHEEGLSRALGTLAGTLMYMAPEQLQGGYIDGRADVYALGMVLYQALTGRLPFASTDADDLRRQVLEREPPSPREKSPEVPRELADICLRALRKRPEDRYGDAAALEEDLRKWARSAVAAQAVPVAPAVAPEPKRRFSPLLLGLLAAAVPCLVLIGWLGLRAVRPTPPSPGPTIEGAAQAPTGAKEGPKKAPVEEPKKDEEEKEEPKKKIVEKKDAKPGTLLVKRGGKGFTPPGRDYHTTGIAWDGKHLWLATSTTNIFEVTTRGKVVRVFKAQDSAPRGMAWIGDRLWTTSSHLDGRILQYRVRDDQLETVSSFPAPIEGVGGRVSDGLAWDGKRLWRSHRHTLTPFSRTGKKGVSVPMPELIGAVAWDGKHLWLAEDPGFRERMLGATAKLHVLDRKGKTLKTYATPLKGIHGLAWADERHLWAVSEVPLEPKLICPLDVSAARRDLEK